MIRNGTFILLALSSLAGALAAQDVEGHSFEFLDEAAEFAE